MIILGIIILLIVGTLRGYNTLVNKRNKVKQSKSTIDVYLTQRFELIPNLVECVKQYSNYEEQNYKQIIELRTEYLQNKDLQEGIKLNTEFNSLIAVAEQYPNLKASEQYLNLQNNLSKMESQLQAARRIYNTEVTTYNNAIYMFPSNIVAKIFRFKEETLFQAEEKSNQNVHIN